MTRPKFATEEEYQEAYGSMWEDEMNRDAQSEQWNSMTPDEQKQSKALAVTEQQTEKKEKTTAVEKFRKYAYLESVQTSFQNLLGGNDKIAKRYVESVVIAVAGSEELQKCSAKSIMLAALRAASLGLSVDPALSQAHLVPFAKEVTLIVDYHGLVQMTVDTNYYQIAPDVEEVYEGQVMVKEEWGGKWILTGQKISSNVIGWRAYFKAKSGVERWLYMTNEELDQHAKTYNPGGFESPKSPWNNKKGANKDKMRRKTCLRIFVKRWGNFSPAQQQVFMQDEPVLDADLIDLPEEPAVEVPVEESKTQEELSAERKARIAENVEVLYPTAKPTEQTGEK